MNCQTAEDNLILATYGELPDELVGALEQHLADCPDCKLHLAEVQAMQQELATLPLLDPSPNLVARARMRLDEALDTMPSHGFLTRLRSNMFAWLGHVQSAPALATLLIGTGFLAGNFTVHYQAAHAPKPHPLVTITNDPASTIANISGIVETPNSEIVQVNYNRIVPETIEGSLDDPQIRRLLVVGTNAATSNAVRAKSVALISDECKTGHSCLADTTSKNATGESVALADGTGIRSVLLVALRTDKNPTVRLKAIEGLQPYVGQDQRVRDAVLAALLHDPSAPVRTEAIDLLQPVQSDSSVRQVLRTVSTRDDNPYIRTASFNALQGAADIQ